MIAKLKSGGKTGALSALRLLNPGLSGGAVLMYHSIGDNDAHFTVSANELDWQLRYLKKTRTVVRLTDFIERMKQSASLAGLVAITLDDGFQDNLTEALPLFEKHDVPATVFVVTRELGTMFPNKSGTPIRLLSEEEAKRLGAHALIDLMPHSLTHPKLTHVPRADAEREMEESRADIESLTGVSAGIFAYPKGRFDAEHANYLRTHRWDGAVSTIEGIVQPADDRFSIKRNSIDRTTNRLQFKAKVSDAIAVYSKLRGIS